MAFSNSPKGPGLFRGRILRRAAFRPGLGGAVLVLALLLGSCEKSLPPGPARFAEWAAQCAQAALRKAGNALQWAGAALEKRTPGSSGGAADLTLHLDQNDEELLRITKDARDTLPVFFRHLLRPAKGEAGFCVKYPFRTDSGSVFGMEQLWLSDITFKNGVYYGVISNIPYYIGSMKRGNTVSFSAGEITDWMYTSGGKIIGGRSIRYLLEQIPGHERSEEQRALLKMFE
jgi:uncharacterized protein YegJ (DUF2314 family)